MKPIMLRGLISQMAHIFRQLSWNDALCKTAVIFETPEITVEVSTTSPSIFLVCQYSGAGGACYEQDGHQIMGNSLSQVQADPSAYVSSLRDLWDCPHRVEFVF